jgi:predicted MFS family arabinose efflux permease
MFIAVFYLFVYDQLKISVQTAGIVLSVCAVGSVIGAVAAPSLLKRIGLGASLAVALVINGIGELAVQASLYGPAILVLSVVWFVTSIGIPIYNVNQVSFRQTIVSDDLQGRMNATMRSFGYGAATVGALVGGAMGAGHGILTVMTIGPIVALLPVVIMFLAPPRGSTSNQHSFPN